MFRIDLRSRPVRGAWIETQLAITASIVLMSRPVRGAWIETPNERPGHSSAWRRAPYGARGLKQNTQHSSRKSRGSRPVRGAWIETRYLPHQIPAVRSRPVRGAWIETTALSNVQAKTGVAPRTGRVD